MRERLCDMCVRKSEWERAGACTYVLQPQSKTPANLVHNLHFNSEL